MDAHKNHIICAVKDATVVVAMILCVLILARSFVQPNHPEPSCFGLDEPGSVLCLSKAFSCSGHYRNSYRIMMCSGFAGKEKKHVWTTLNVPLMFESSEKPE
uniref:Uncharacterized protein n=1 Tax=Salarias fasciatus TaxID=181472 RepID=A0A672FLN0_SALFA